VDSKDGKHSDFMSLTAWEMVLEHWDVNVDWSDSNRYVWRIRKRFDENSGRELSNVVRVLRI
jgi:hypothetical protein